MISRISAVLCLGASVLVAGCAGGGIEVKGPGFHIGGGKKKEDVKVPDRAPLIIPPNQARLPQPQTEPVAATTAAPNWPTDPDVTRKEEEKVADKKKKDYEDHGDWNKKAPIDEFEKLMDPMERKEGILNKILNKDKKN